MLQLSNTNINWTGKHAKKKIYFILVIVLKYVKVNPQKLLER